MKRLILVFLLGAVCGVLGFRYYERRNKKDPVEQARDSVKAGVERVRDAVQDVVGDIKPESIQEELAKTGVVIREKARQATDAIADAAANAKTTTVIKTRLAAEMGVTALTINVDTSGGLVTLTGTVPAREDLARAIRIALATENVTKVVSTLQVKPRS